MANVKCPDCGFKIQLSENNSIPDKCPCCFSKLFQMKTLEFEYSEQIENSPYLTSSKAHGIRLGDKIILRGKEFLIIEIISEGTGEAVIYKIENDSKQSFALKLYRDFWSSKEEPNVETLKKIKDVNDPNILKLHDFGVGADKYQEKHCYEISDFAGGGDLFAVANFKEKYSKEFIEKIIVPQILNGIVKLHQLKIYHCDLKPSNIFYKDINQTDLLIGDYGWAKVFDLELESEVHKTSQVRGTAVFMAPEQARGIIAEKNDYYSFGIILLYLLYPEQISDDNNIMKVDKSKFERIVERQFNLKPMIEFSPEFKRLNTLIEGLTLFNPINRFGKRDVEKWLYGQENEPQHEATTHCKICGNLINYQNMPGFMLGAGICLECNFKTNKKMKQFNFICENNHNNYFSDRNNPPIECSGCFEAFDFNKVVEVDNENDGEIEGLSIIYQINQQRLEISTFHKTILGRENFGASVFSNIFFNGKPVVSRKHCSIEFSNGKFYLLDEGSLNGTFYGVNKISCKNSPQMIEGNSIFYIGEEAFLAHINYRESKQEKSPKVEEPKKEEVKAIKLYRCNESGCGHESQTLISVCPKCNTYNSLIPIYE